MPNYGAKCPEVWRTNYYYGAVADLAPGYIATIIQYGKLVYAIEKADEMSEVNEIAAKHKDWIKSKEVKA